MGSRDLSFGGVNVWSEDGSFYAPVWSSDYSKDDLAIAKVRVERDLVHSVKPCFKGFEPHFLVD